MGKYYTTELTGQTGREVWKNWQTECSHSSFHRFKLWFCTEHSVYFLVICPIPLICAADHKAQGFLVTSRSPRVPAQGHWLHPFTKERGSLLMQSLANTLSPPHPSYVTYSSASSTKISFLSSRRQISYLLHNTDLEKIAAVRPHLPRWPTF